jgi:hypothetical protein
VPHGVRRDRGIRNAIHLFGGWRFVLVAGFADVAPRLFRHDDILGGGRGARVSSWATLDVAVDEGERCVVVEFGPELFEPSVELFLVVVGC